MTFKNSVSRHFGRASSTYPHYADVQRLCAKHLVSNIPLSVEASQALDIGCGTGLASQYLVRRWPSVKIDLLDSSEAMLVAAKQCVGVSVSNLFHGSADSWEYDKEYDLIVSSSALHWIRPMELAVTRMAESLAPGGWLCISLMLQGTLEPLRSLRIKLVPDKPPREQLPTIKEVQAALNSASLSTKRVETRRLQKEYGSADEFLGAIRAMGVTGGGLSLSDKVLNRGELTALRRALENNSQRPSGRVTVSYTVGNFYAQKV